jgi:hypothetical protein
VSIVHARVVTCACGARVELSHVESLNGARHPHLRQRVLDRALHTARCGACGAGRRWRSRLTYVDLERRQLIGVYLHDDRPHARICAEELVGVHDRCMRNGPTAIRAIADDCLVRVVFGYEELREKLVCDDAGVRDLALEAAKHELMAEPALQAMGAVTLRLDAVEGDTLRLFPEDTAGEPLPLMIELRRAVVDAMPARDRLLASYPGIASGPHVSLLRLAYGAG